MKQILIATIIFALTFVVVYGQKPALCKLTKEKSPNLRGFVLGNDVSSLKSRFSNLEVGAPDEFGNSHIVLEFYPLPGVQSIYYGYDKLPNKIDARRMPEFKGWETMSVDLLDNRIVILTVDYDDSANWSDITDFTDLLSKTFNLPNAWIYPDEEIVHLPDGEIEIDKGKNSYMDCADFRLETALESSGIPFLRIIDPSAQKVYDQRMIEKEKKARKKFKP